FGILKYSFYIFIISPEYDMDIQAQIPVALCQLYNFIYYYNSANIDNYIDAIDLVSSLKNKEAI
ncbi:hypothetical protein BYT27DRAFT_7106188, partial [Phlegmacium glaucopus]